ncbi:MAG: hypothetical protein LAP21_13185 [Acidobacteriia bacterium]|nr:hypothetical protein [Terriglobia bacterium]
MQFCVTHAHRTLLAFVLLLAGAPLLAAQTQAFDITSFTPPSGWTVAQGDDHITFTFIDQAAGYYVMLAVYNSTARAGDPEKDFASEWKNVVVKSFSQVSAPRSMSNRTKSGLEFREGGSGVSKNGSTSYVKLMVFPAEKRMFSVLAVASNQGVFEGKQAVVRSFLDSMKISAQPAASGRTPTAGGGNSSSANAGSIGAGGAPRSGSGIAGVWLGFKANYPSYEPRPRWYVYFEDGTVFEDLPRKGLAGFNREASKGDPGQKNYWGSYSASGSSGTINRPGVRYPEKIEVEAPGKMKLDGLVFNRCRPVDGLRLQGAWTSYANPNDPSLDRVPRGQAPIFHFTSDGRFVDDGVLAVFLHDGGGSADAAGAGTYEIRDFTLILRYSDGRVKPFAFSGLCPGDPFTSNDLIFIARSEFRKRK